MPTSFGGRRIYTSWGVTLFFPTRAEHKELLHWWKRVGLSLQHHTAHKELLHWSESGECQTSGKQTSQSRSAGGWRDQCGGGGDSCRSTAAAAPPAAGGTSAAAAAIAVDRRRQRPHRRLEGPARRRQQ
jgi:hypothetical protein